MRKKGQVQEGLLAMQRQEDHALSDLSQQGPTDLPELRGRGQDALEQRGVGPLQDLLEGKDLVLLLQPVEKSPLPGVQKGRPRGMRLRRLSRCRWISLPTVRPSLALSRLPENGPHAVLLLFRRRGIP